MPMSANKEEALNGAIVRLRDETVEYGNATLSIRKASELIK